MNSITTGFNFSFFTRVAVSAAALVFIFLISISLLLPSLSPFLAILLTGIVFLGFPHGALDIFLLRSFRYEGLTPITALTIYVFTVLAMIAAWLLAPSLAFAFFIAYSCFHFAQSDVSWELRKSNFITLDFAARLFIPFFIPFGLHSERSLALARMIHPGYSLAEFTGLFFVLAASGIFLSVVLLLRGLHRKFIQKLDWDSQSLEPFVLSALFIFMDPLYSIGIYFCFVHSVKHIVNFLNSPVEVNFQALIPFWLIPVFTVIAFCIYYEGTDLRIEDSLFKWSIIIISSVALPHTLLIYFGKRIGLIR